MAHKHRWEWITATEFNGVDYYRWRQCQDCLLEGPWLVGAGNDEPAAKRRATGGKR